MHIRFAEADQNFINAQAELGFYANETEVVRDAVRRLREQKEMQQSGFYKAVMQGHQQIERGATTPFNADLMQRMNREAAERVARGEVIASDHDHGV